MTQAADGRSLELYFIDGRPDGMLTAEVFNWTGHLLMSPRTRITEALSRKEAGYTGVYLLLGEQDGEARVYVGEGEDIGERIRSHDAKKDWWTTVLLVTSAANNLNKAHVKYLESRLVEEAKSVGRVAIDNGNTPPRPSLSEAGISNMEAFLGYLLMVLPALRIEVFVRNTRPVLQRTVDGGAASPRFRMISKKHGLTAKAVLENGEFIVEAGSHARLRWEGSANWGSGYAALHEELRKTGVLQDQDDRCVFAQNYAFKSPSAAAAVVSGRIANGTTEWKVDGSGLTYKEWEANQLAKTIMVAA